MGSQTPNPICSSKWRVRAPAGDHPVNQAGDEQDHEDNGDELGDVREGTGQTRKTEECRSDSKYKEGDYPVKHDILLNGLDQIKYRRLPIFFILGALP